MGIGGVAAITRRVREDARTVCYSFFRSAVRRRFGCLAFLRRYCGLDIAELLGRRREETEGEDVELQENRKPSPRWGRERDPRYAASDEREGILACFLLLVSIDSAADNPVFSPIHFHARFHLTPFFCIRKIEYAS